MTKVAIAAAVYIVAVLAFLLGSGLLAVLVQAGAMGLAASGLHDLEKRSR